jgi:hypothetical protein
MKERLIRKIEGGGGEEVVNDKKEDRL